MIASISSGGQPWNVDRVIVLESGVVKSSVGEVGERGTLGDLRSQPLDLRGGVVHRVDERRRPSAYWMPARS